MDSNLPEKPIPRHYYQKLAREQKWQELRDQLSVVVELTQGTNDKYNDIGYDSLLEQTIQQYINATKRQQTLLLKIISSLLKLGAKPPLLLNGQNTLSYAWFNYISLFKVLLDYSDFSLTHKYSSGKNLIQLAAEAGNWDVVDKIIAKKGKTINAWYGKDIYQYTYVLCLAAWKNRTNTVIALLKNGASILSKVNIKGQCCSSPILWAVHHRNAEMLIALLKQPDADLSAVNADWKTSIQLCVQASRWDLVQLIANFKDGRHLKQDNYHYGYALTNALSVGSNESIAAAKELLTSGAPTDVRLSKSDDAFGNTPLHWAIKKNNVSMAETLIDHGADLSGLSKRGNSDKNYNESALMYAARTKKWEIVSAIAKKIEDKKITYKNDKADLGYALTRAAEDGNVEAVKALLKLGATTNVILEDDRHKNTPLHWAIHHDCPEMVEALIEHNADLTLKDNFGKTPLKYGTEYNKLHALQAVADTFAKPPGKLKKEPDEFGYVVTKMFELDLQPRAREQVNQDRDKIIKTFLEVGASTKVILPLKDDSNQNTALHWAGFKGKGIAVRNLIRAGADLSAKNNSNKTPIQVAAKNGKWKTVKAIAIGANTKHTAIESDIYKYGDALVIAASTIVLNTASAADKTIAIAAFKELLNAGAPVNVVTDKNLNQSYKASLHYLAETDNNIELIESLIDKGANLSMLTASKETPIQIAAINKNWNTVIAIAKKSKAKYSFFNNDLYHYEAALKLAVENDNVDVIVALVQAGTKLPGDILHIAASKGSLNTYKHLYFFYNFNITATNKDKKTVLEIAAENQHWNLVAEIANNLKQKKLKSNKDTYKVDYALRLAAKGNSAANETAVEALLKAGAMQNNVDPLTGNLALHEAVLSDNPVIINHLFNNEANVSIKNKQGNTPMRLAVSDTNNFKWIAVKTIAEHNKVKKINSNNDKASINEDIDSFKYALYVAAQFNKSEIVTSLLDAGTPVMPTKLNTGGIQTPLFWVIEHNNISILKAMLNKGGNLADKRMIDKPVEKTPIYYAATIGHWDLVIEIIKTYPTIDTTTERDIYHYGHALVVAVKSNNLLAVKALLNAGARTDIVLDEDTGNTALHIAILNDNVDIVRALLEKGAAKYALNKKNQTPIDYLSQSNPNKLTSIKVVKYMLHESLSLVPDEPILSNTNTSSVQMPHKFLFDEKDVGIFINNTFDLYPNCHNDKGYQELCFELSQYIVISADPNGSIPDNQNEYSNVLRFLFLSNKSDHQTENFKTNCYLGLLGLLNSDDLYNDVKKTLEELKKHYLNLNLKFSRWDYTQVEAAFKKIAQLHKNGYSGIGNLINSISMLNERLIIQKKINRLAQLPLFEMILELKKMKIKISKVKAAEINIALEGLIENYLIPISEDNDEVKSNIGDIYFLLGNFNKACDYWFSVDKANISLIKKLSTLYCQNIDEELKERIEPYFAASYFFGVGPMVESNGKVSYIKDENKSLSLLLEVIKNRDAKLALEYLELIAKIHDKSINTTQKNIEALTQELTTLEAAEAALEPEKTNIKKLAHDVNMLEAELVRKNKIKASLEAQLKELKETKNSNEKRQNIASLSKKITILAQDVAETHNLLAKKKQELDGFESGCVLSTFTPQEFDDLVRAINNINAKRNSIRDTISDNKNIYESIAFTYDDVLYLINILLHFNAKEILVTQDSVIKNIYLKLVSKFQLLLMNNNSDMKKKEKSFALSEFTPQEIGRLIVALKSCNGGAKILIMFLAVNNYQSASFHRNEVFQIIELLDKLGNNDAKSLIIKINANIQNIPREKTFNIEADQKIKSINSKIAMLQKTKQNQLEVSRLVKDKLVRYYLDNNNFELAAHWAFLESKPGKLTETQKKAFKNVKVLCLLPGDVVFDILNDEQNEEFISTDLLNNYILPEYPDEDGRIQAGIFKDEILYSALLPNDYLAYSGKLTYFAISVFELFNDKKVQMKLNSEEKQKFLLYLLSVQPELLLNSVVYEYAQKLFCEASGEQQRKLIKLLPYFVENKLSVQTGAYLERLLSLVNPTTFTDELVQFMRDMNFPNKVFAHILMNKNSPGFSSLEDEYIAVYQDHVSELNLVYDLIDKSKVIESKYKDKWKKELRTMAFEFLKQQSNEVDGNNVDDIIELQKYLSEAKQNDIFTKNRNGFFAAINYETNTSKQIRQLQNYAIVTYFKKNTVKSILELYDSHQNTIFADIASKYVKSQKIGTIESGESLYLVSLLSDKGRVGDFEKLEEIKTYLLCKENQNKKLYKIIQDEFRLFFEAHEYDELSAESSAEEGSNETSGDDSVSEHNSGSFISNSR